MAATILVREVLRRVSDRLNDLDPQFTSYTEHELVNALNDGQAVLCTYAPVMCTRIDSIKLRAGPLQSIETIAAEDCKPADGSTPSGPIYGKQFVRPICMMGDNGLTIGKALRMSDMKLMAAMSPNWMQQSGEQREVFYDPQMPKYFHVNKPVPASGTFWMRIAFVAQPQQVPNTGTPEAPLYAHNGSNNTKITVDDECLDPLVNYIVAVASLKDMPGADPTAAATAANLFTTWLNAKVTALTGHNPNLKRLPMAPQPLAAAS